MNSDDQRARTGTTGDVRRCRGQRRCAPSPGQVPALHGGYGLFDAVDDLVRTRPAPADVNGLRAILVAWPTLIV